jgi:membrane protein required for colicin V production
MSWVDIVIIAGAVIGAIAGFKQGLVLSIFSFLGLIVGVAIAGAASDSLAEKLSTSGALWAYVVSFAIILIIVLVIFSILGHIVKGFIKLIMLGWLDSIGGALVGLFVGGLIVAAIFIAIGKWAAGAPPGTTSVGTAIGNSALAHFLIDSFRLLLALLPGRFDAVAKLFK